MYKHDAAIFCKSFRDDFDRLKLLLSSVAAQKFDLPVLISVPENDLELLKSIVGPSQQAHIVTDESYVIPGTPFQYGWLQQQVCKLSVYRTNFAKSYIMIDSDTYFIDDARRLVDHCNQGHIVASSVFTKFFAANDRLIGYLRQGSSDAPISAAGRMDGFDDRLAAVLDKFDEIDKKKPDEKGHIINDLFAAPQLAFQPSQLFHSRILEEFSNFLAERGMDFYSCLKIAPWEYNWYACFALAKWPGAITCICSPVLHFATEADILDAKKMGFTVDDFKRRFVAIQMAARHFEGTAY